MAVKRPFRPPTLLSPTGGEGRGEGVSLYILFPVNARSAAKASATSRPLASMMSSSMSERSSYQVRSVGLLRVEKSRLVLLDPANSRADQRHCARPPINPMEMGCRQYPRRQRSTIALAACQS